MIDQVISHYRITAKLGAGGMGEVYRATDTKLGRDVALKVLPAALAGDAQRMARFQREAQLLASLNHPNIATIHGLEQTDGIHALVMEVVEGPTLAEQIASAPLPVDAALRIARQIAEALEYAHDRGIVHRDLKPANIKLTPDGNVKVLDFGLAKAIAEDVAAPSSGLDFSPTMSFAATRAGLILGTAAYMAPEQAKGKAVDRRADVWAFGAVLYEMLTGQRAFHGEDASEILASVIKSDPDWSALPEKTPPQISKLLRRCLEKDSRRRLQAIGEARIQIEEVMADSSATTAVMSAVTTAPTPMWRRAMPWAIAAVMTLAFAAAIVALLLTPPAPEPAVVRFDVELKNMRFAGGSGSRLVISPDGKKIVMAGREGSAEQRLYQRSLDGLEFSAIPGTEGAAQPFFSPDSQWLAFSANSKLKKVSLAGGVPLTLCDLQNPTAAGTWLDGGKIAFAHRSGLFVVPDGGGTPEKVADPAAEKEGAFVWLSSLPGGRDILGVPSTRSGGTFRIYVLSLETGKRELLVENGSWPRYLRTGHILFAQFGNDQSSPGFTGGLLAVPFDLKTRKRTDSPFPVVEGVRVGSGGAGYYDIAENGTLVFATGSGQAAAPRNLALLDGKGKPELLAAPPRNYADIAISPDGSRVAVSVIENAVDVYTYDLRRGTLQRLTFDSANRNPVFTPDSARIVYASTSGGAVQNLWWKPADGSGTAERLTTSESSHRPRSFSPDGKLLLFTQGELSQDIYVLPLEGERKPRPFLQTQFHESEARFSPDGKWIAYISNESGSFEVYVQPYPGPGGKWQISQGGGGAPQWSRDGKKLYYLTRNEALMVVDVTPNPSFSAGKARTVAENLDLRAGLSRNYDIAADGRVLFAPRVETERPADQSDTVRVVLNFLTEVRRRLPAEK